MLYIVATPIGNLEDITLRAWRILREVDYIFCEDTRVTRKLLNHYDIENKKLISYHQHTSEKKVNELVKIIKNYNVALVTDAGTPGVSDPGNKLIKKIVEMQFIESGDIIPIPGPSALTAALSISGLPTDKFLFLGFVPHKKGRRKFLQQVLESEVTVVFYESCHRIVKCLEQMAACKDVMKKVSEKHLVVARELTKKFETIYRGNIDEVLRKIKEDPIKGEYVVLVGR